MNLRRQRFRIPTPKHVRVAVSLQELIRLYHGHAGPMADRWRQMHELFLTNLDCKQGMYSKLTQLDMAPFPRVYTYGNDSFVIPLNKTIFTQKYGG